MAVRVQVPLLRSRRGVYAVESGERASVVGAFCFSGVLCCKVLEHKEGSC